MRKFIIVLISWAVSFNMFAQKDPDAIAALDKVSENIKNSTAWKIEFDYIINNIKDNSQHKQSGTLKLKGDKYILDLLGNVLYYDGKKNYNYLKEANEVNIMPPEDNTDELFFISPSNLFNFYKEGYKSKYTGEKMVGNKKLLDIDLFPEELSKEYFRINILVDPVKNLIYSFKVFNKDGIQYEVIMKNTQPVELQDADFTFDPKKHPKVEIIDLTN